MGRCPPDWWGFGLVDRVHHEGAVGAISARRATHSSRRTHRLTLLAAIWRPCVSA